MYTGYYDCCLHHHYAPPCHPHAMPSAWIVFLPPELCDHLKVPREIDADTTSSSASALVGGGADKISLSLEYLVEAGATSPSVKVTTSSDGGSATWSDDTPSTGYHVQEALLSVTPGSKVTLNVNNATARLRWCETICC